MIKFLTLNRIKTFNKELEEVAKENNKIDYIYRDVPDFASNTLEEFTHCVEKYHLKKKDLILTATYYLKNIIVLQSFIDGNHRTALYSTECFLKLNGVIIKNVDNKCLSDFRHQMWDWREKDYHSHSSMTSMILKLEENIPVEENYTFEYCLKFIKNKMLGQSD